VTVAVARRTDPATSHAAAVSILDTRRAQNEVLSLYPPKVVGGLTDEAMIRRARRYGIRQSESGLRTRRSELVTKGLIEDSGRRETIESGRKAIVWRVVA
jgi:hypothetical protein